MAASISTNVLDHIVHLTSPGSVEATSEQFRKLGFNVIPGGTHSDGLTTNALVVFKDGIYLELICFTHPPSHYPPGSPARHKRDTNRWASKPLGWIDFAFLGNGSLISPRISDIINDRAKQDGTDVKYMPEQAGGRRRPDGQELKWVISAPEAEKGGTLPFFCGDVTPREWRVPGDPPSNTEHPSTARGIAHVCILTSAQTLTSVSRELTSVVGEVPATATDVEVFWILGTVYGGDRDGPKLILSSPKDEDEASFVGNVGTGIYEVAFTVDHDRGGTGATPYGRIVWTPLE